MEPRSSLAAVVTDERPAVGTTLKSASPDAAEALGYTPLDFLFVDRQHGTPVLETLAHVVRAADLNDLPVIVRIPRDDPSDVTSMLDLGVRGIVVPQVENAETVREVASHVRYADGRSLGSYTRAARFGNVPKDRYAEYVNEELALLPMIETATGVDAVDDIASVDAVAALTIGPGDLAWSLGVPFDSDEHVAAIDEIFERAAAHDCPVGIFAPTVAHVERDRDRAAFLVHSSDVSLAVSHFESLLGDEW